MQPHAPHLRRPSSSEALQRVENHYRASIASLLKPTFKGGLKEHVYIRISHESDILIDRMGTREFLGMIPSILQNLVLTSL